MEIDNDILDIEKKSKKKSKIILLTILNIFTLVSSLFLIYSIYKISGIENLIRYIAMGVIFIINILLIFATRKVSKKATTIIVIVLSVLLLIGQAGAGYFIYKTYSSLNSMNKSKITYTTVIATKSDSKIDKVEDLSKHKIGIVVDETSIDGYVIGLEIIKNKDLESNNEIVEYTSITTMAKDLYDSKIDAMIISKNYPSMLKTVDGFSDIEEKTKVIFESSKTLSKEEIAKYAGDEVLNFNSSNKIDKPFTLLVMGIDSTEKELSKNATGNGDSLMLITFNPKTLNATILSIPRDTYVPIACFSGQRENKITHAAWNGESCMIKTIENFTGIDIDYYVKINFQGVINLVDALGGIEADVPLEFCESNSRRSTKEENLVCLKKGKQTLNGEQALALARHRKTLLTGDLQRGVNQQLVVQGILNKIKTVRNANQLLNVLDTISKSMDTNFSTKQIMSFYSIAKTLLKTNRNSNFINMTQLYLQGASEMIYDEGIGMVLYNYIPNKESLEQIVKAMKQNLGIEKTELIKRMDFDIDKPFKIETIGDKVSSGTNTYSLLPSFIGSSESYARSWLSARGIGVTTTIKEVDKSSGYFDGQVLDQSYPANKRLDMISGSINLTVAKLKKEENTNTNDNNTTDTNTPTPGENTNTDQSNSGQGDNTTPEEPSDHSTDESDNQNNPNP